MAAVDGEPRVPIGELLLRIPVKEPALPRFTLNPKRGPAEVDVTLVNLCRNAILKQIDGLGWEKIPLDLRVEIYNDLKLRKKLKDRHLLLLRGADITELELTGFVFSDAALGNIASALPRLRLLSIANCSAMTSKAFGNLLETCTALEDVRLGSCTFFDDALDTLAQIPSALSVKSFSLQAHGQWLHGSLLRLSVLVPDFLISSLEFQNSKDALFRISRYFPNLTAIEFEWNNSINAEIVASLADLFPTLTSLSLPWCRSVTDTALDVIAKRLSPNLTTLNIEQCRYSTEQGIVKLYYLARRFLFLGLKTSLLRIKVCPYLNFLSLKGLSELSNDVAFVISQSLPNLKVLNLVRCYNFNDDGLLEILNSCKDLKYLSIVGLSSLTDVSCLKLVEMKDSLAAVDICDTNFAEEIKKALKDIDVNQMSEKREVKFIRSEVLR